MVEDVIHTEFLSMTNSNDPRNDDVNEESFSALLSDYERTHSKKKEDGNRQMEGTVVSVTPDAVLVDIGYKTEGTLPLSEVPDAKAGDKVLVTVKGRDPEGYYQLSRQWVATPTDWGALEQAFADKSTIVGTVTGLVKGGLSVDVGVRAFMPASLVCMRLIPRRHHPRMKVKQSSERFFT